MKVCTLLAVVAAVAFSFTSSAAEKAEPFMRPCWRNLTSGAREKIAEYKKAAKGYKRHVDRTKLFVRGQFFYGLGKQYYIRNYYERPLMQDSSLAASNEPGHMLNPESWKRTVGVGRDMLLDGFAFFPTNPGCWDVLPRSVMPGGEATILAELHNGDRGRGVAHCADVAGRILAAPNAFKIRGRVVITCYPAARWSDKAALDFWPKLAQELERRHGPGKFAFMPYMSLFDGADLDKGEMTEEILERTRAHLREILEKTDGIFYWLRESSWAAPEVLRRPHDEIVAPLVKSVLAEEKFKDKFLGVGYWQGHENVYRRFGDIASIGFVRLVTALETIEKLQPDFATAFEWDEQNENTHFRPTVSNGKTTQRVMRHFADRIAGRKPSLYPGDEKLRDIPNVAVAYRKSVQAGEHATVQVLAIPDGTEPGGDWTVSFAWKSASGRVVRSFPPKSLASGKCGMVSFTCPAAELVCEQVLEPELVLSAPGRAARTFSDGLWPMNVEANRNPDCKWVRQALRDVAAGTTGSISVGPAQADGTRKVEGRVSGPVPFRSIEVLEGQDTVYMHDAAKPAGRDDDGTVRFRIAFYALPCFWKEHSSTGIVAVLDSPGVVLSEVNSGLTRRGANTWEFRHKNPMLNFVNVFYADVPAAEARKASILIDLPSAFPRLRVKTADIIDRDAMSFAGPAGVQAVVSRELAQRWMPPPCGVREAKFSFKTKPRSPLSVFRLQAVDENYRVWRGKAVTLLKPSGKTESFAVFEAETSRVARVDSARIVKPSYRFGPRNGDAYYPAVWRDVPLVGGGGAGLLLGLGCGNSFRYGHATAVGKFALNSGADADRTAPRLVTERDGGCSLEFSGSSFMSMPLQVIPIFAGFELRMKVMPLGMSGTEGLVDSGRQGFQLYLEDGVPTAFTALGNVIAKLGVNEVAGPTVKGPALKKGEWNDLVYRFDQRHAWFEVNGVAGERVPCSGKMANADVAAIGVALQKLKFFRGKIASIDVRPYGGEDNGGKGDAASAPPPQATLPQARVLFTDAFKGKGWMTWGPHYFAPAGKGFMKIEDGRIYLSPPCAETSPIPSPACAMGAKLRFSIEAKCPKGCRIGVFSYAGKECTRLWSGQFEGTAEFKRFSFETELPAPAGSVRCAVQGAGEYRSAEFARRVAPGFSIEASPAYQMSGDGAFEPVSFALLKDGKKVDAPQLVVEGLSAYDPESGAVARAYAEVGDAGKFAVAAGRVRLTAPVSILYLGDSLTHFDIGRNHADKVAYFLNKANPGMVRMYNYACGGDHVGTVVARLDGKDSGKWKDRYADLWSRSYDWAFVFLGHNDTKASSRANYTEAVVPPARQEALYRDLIARLRAKGVRRIVLMSSTSSDFSVCEALCKGRKGVHNRFGDPRHLEAFNATLRKVASAEKVEYLDLYDKMKAMPDKASLLRRQDGVHLTAAGNDFVALETLEYLARSQRPDSSNPEFFQKW